MNHSIKIVALLAITSIMFSSCRKEDNPEPTPVVDVKVTGVSLDKSSASLTEGETLTLTATVAPGDATNKNTTWSSSDSKVATVQSGLVTAVSAGTAVVTVTTVDGGKQASCAISVTPKHRPVTGLNLKPKAVTIHVDEVTTMSATIIPEDASNKNVFWDTSDMYVAYVDENGNVVGVLPGVATITAISEDGLFSDTCEVTVIRDVPEGAVDLGLINLMWASCNLGASKPEEYGDYYEWGNAETMYEGGPQAPSSWKKEGGYRWSNYKYWVSGSSNMDLKMSKYCSTKGSSYWGGSGDPDNKLVLEPEDDAAIVKLGNGWRMPTLDDYNYLFANCDTEWTSLNGVAGVKLTSRIAGYTDKWIFFPASGRMDGTNVEYSGSSIYYWTSSLSVDTPSHAYGLVNVFDQYGVFSMPRYMGFTIRPVHE